MNPFTPFTPVISQPLAPSCIDSRRSAFGSRVRSGAVALDIPNPEATCGPFFVEAPDHFLYR